MVAAALLLSVSVRLCGLRSSSRSRSPAGVSGVVKESEAGPKQVSTVLLLQVNVVKEILTLFPTGGPPVAVLEKDIKAGQAIVQTLSGILIPASLVCVSNHSAPSRSHLGMAIGEDRWQLCVLCFVLLFKK